MGNGKEKSRLNKIIKKQKTEYLPTLSALGREKTWVCLVPCMVMHSYGEEIYAGI